MYVCMYVFRKGPPIYKLVYNPIQRLWYIIVRLVANQLIMNLFINPQLKSVYEIVCSSLSQLFFIANITKSPYSAIFPSFHHHFLLAPMVFQRACRPRAALPWRLSNRLQLLWPGQQFANLKMAHWVTVDLPNLKMVNFHTYVYLC